MNKPIASTELKPAVTTGPLPASRKIFVTPDEAPDLRVPLREIILSEGAGEPNLPVYDTSGPYTDPSVTIDVNAGLTRARIAWVIEQEFGVSYHKGHVARLLQELNWTPQVPITRAIQRDEAAIKRWRVEVWPNLQARARRERRALVFIDESGFYLLPGVVKTYGPKGQTPVIDEWQTRDHLSVMAGVTPGGKLYTLVRQEALTCADSVIFLHHLLRQTGKRLLVIWDGSPIHRWKEVREFLSGEGAKKVYVEALPGYAPDLNPLDQGVWHHLKHVEMRNLTCLDLEQLHLEFHLAVGRLRQKPHLIKSCFAQAGLVI